MARNCFLLPSIFLLPFFLLAPQKACAELPALEQTLAIEATLTTLITFATENNPAIRAAQEQLRATMGRYRSATGLPDPQLMATYFTDPIETRLGPQDWNMTLSQTVPFPTKLSGQARLMTAEAEISRLEVDRSVRDVVMAVRQSYHELHYIQTARDIAGQTMDLLDHLRKMAETAHADDRATLVDVMKAQSQTAQLRYDILLLEELEQTEKTQLNALLNRRPDAPLTLAAHSAPPILSMDVTEIFQLAADHQQEIAIAEARIRKAEAGRDLASAAYMPDLKLGIFYAGIGEPDLPSQPADAGEDAFGIQAGISIPLWFGKNIGRVAEATAITKKAEAQKEAQVNSSRAAIQTVYFRLHNAQRLITLYEEELIPQAHMAMETSQTWFQEGDGSFSDFVETATTWYNFQLALARAQADYGKYLAQLEQLAGLPLTGANTSTGPNLDREAIQ